MMKIQIIGATAIALACAMASWDAPAMTAPAAGSIHLARQQAGDQIDAAAFIADGTSPNYLQDRQRLLTAPGNGFGAP